MPKITKADETELSQAYYHLKLSSFKGKGNFCPRCKRTGDFGSIVKYTCESNNEYLICVWCGNIDKIKVKQ